MNLLFKVGVILFILSAVIGGAMWASESPWFQVSEVTITGNNSLSSSEISHTADVLGQNVLLLNLNQVSERIKALPLVKDVKVYTQPFQEVVISIEERQPKAIWRVGSTDYIVDDDGVVLGKSSAVQTLPIINEVQGSSKKPGQKVDAQAIALSEELSTIIPVELGLEPHHFEYLEGAGLVVETKNGFRARYGDYSDLAYKTEVWKGILTAAAQQNIKVTHVDLRFGTRPFLR